MHLLSVNIAQPQDVEWRGTTVHTSIFKRPEPGPVAVLADRLAGDGQADYRHHGGPDKAVYAYPAEHWAYWSTYVPHEKLGPGAFGENLTTEGLLESEVYLGDCFRVGSAVLMAMQPRVPCFKLNIRLDDEQMVRRFQRAGRSGIYFRVVQPGTLQMGDAITLVERSRYAVTIQQVVDNYHGIDQNLTAIRAILEVPFLRPSLQAHFRAIVARAGSGPAAALNG